MVSKQFKADRDSALQRALHDTPGQARPIRSGFRSSHWLADDQVCPSEGQTTRSEP